LTARVGFRTEWTVREGVKELYECCVREGLTRDGLERYVRLNRIQELRASGRLDATLRPTAPAMT
jgi:hypothetical protein